MTLAHAATPAHTRKPAAEPPKVAPQSVEPEVEEVAGMPRFMTGAQFKLTMGTPNDALEHEADRTAERVMRWTAPGGEDAPRPPRGPPTIQRRCSACSSPIDELRPGAASRSIQRKCSACAAAEKRSDPPCAECADERVQRRAKGSHRSARAAGEVEGGAASRVHALRGGGAPLPQSARDYFEPRFGYDFSGVRVHSGGSAAASAAELGAYAYTLGDDIVFGAGAYAPDNDSGRYLLAHELTHTIQQTGGVPLPASAERPSAAAAHPQTVSRSAQPRVQRWPSVDDVLDTLDEAVSTAGDVVDEAGKVVDEVGGALEDAGEAVAEGAEAAYDTAVEAGGQVVDAASEAIDWLATEAGQAAQALADATGGIVSITSAGLVISVPRICPLDAYTDEFDLGSMDEEFMVPIGALPLGPVALLGEVGIAGHLAATAGVQLGPFCLNGLRIVINPLTGTYSFSYSVSATAAASLAAEIRGGLRGALSLIGVIPIGGVPVPIEVPLIGVEGGLAGLVRGIAATTLTIGSSSSIGGTTLTLTEDRTLDLGLAADLFLGAYAQLDILGKNICRIYWQPYDWHGDIAGSLDLGVGVTISAGASPSVALTVTPPSFTRIPFSDIPLALSREGFADDCPIKDAICEVLTELNLLPSQNGGVWNWGGPYGPGPRLAGPLDVYQKNPGIASGSECRGACGPNCDTCTPTPKYLYTDPATGDVWEYVDFQDCNYQQGCLDHDAAFDWAADKHGETGGLAIIMPWHMAANIECGCNNLGGNCIAWIAGLPPYSGKIYFAVGATLVTPGGVPPVGPTPGTLGTGCHTDFPNAPECTASFPERDAVLEAWGTPNRIVDFRDCAVALSGAAMSLAACNGGPGNLWRCKATDQKTGEDVTVSIQECICCNPDDSRSSEWMQPQIVITPDMSEELILELCERGLIARVICIPLEEDMLARFGRRRDMKVDPDKDPKTEMRPDDAPILESFRRAHNRLDSWDLYIGARHPELVAEFEAVEGGCATRSMRDERMANVKKRTARYKTEFRDTRNTDPQKTAADYETDIRAIQTAIETCISAVAKWYLARTGSSESEADVTERVHAEGTEIWREKWRKASLQVNRILARLWPGARTRILVWVGVKRAEHPGTDLSGGVGELDYIGSLATGFKGPPKQQIRFDPRKFDVDANLDAPPLAKYAIAFAGARPDRGRIFGRTSLCDPLIEFSNSAGTELASVEGYDTSDLFDVALVAVPLPEQARGTAATERLYALRQTLIDRSDEASYTKMVDELNAAGLLAPDGRFREEISEDEAAKANEIMDRYEKAPAPAPTP